MPTSAAGYLKLLKWARSWGCVRRAGLEGTGTYGAGLALMLREHGIEVLEVNRPDRAKRRLQGKSDPTDAENAARSVLSGETTSVPKPHSGAAEAMRVISVARRSAVKAKTQAINQLRAMWPGSILDCLAAVLSSARKEIVMISPYWSDAGVESIFRRITDCRFAGLRVVILTLPEAHHKSEALRALHNFRRKMVEGGANCEIFSFPISNQWTPLLHAKSLVADGLHAYVGSANLTGNGMDASVEIGLSFHGAKAAHLRDWMMALSMQLEAW